MPISFNEPRSGDREQFDHFDTIFKRAITWWKPGADRSLSPAAQAQPRLRTV